MDSTDPLNESEWLIGKAVVRGKGHIDSGLPCQDSCAVRTSADGAWLVAAVSDGAGTASKADAGAQAVTAGVADRLIALVPKIEMRGPGAWLRDEIHRALIEVRDSLRERKGDIRDFHCTVVGILLGETGGTFFHIGDGLALGSKARLIGEDDASSSLSLWNELIVSPPKNGEYANETFFVTQDDWYRHLSTTILPGDLDIVALMSDGVMPFVVARGFHPNSRFIDPIVGTLLRTADGARRNELFANWLASPDTHPITDDDKTLFVAARRKLAEVAHRPIAPYIMDPNSKSAIEIPADPPQALSSTVTGNAAASLQGASSPASDLSAAVHMTRLSFAASLMALLVALGALGISCLAYRHHAAPAQKPDPAPARVEPAKPPSGLPAAEGTEKPMGAGKASDKAVETTLGETK